MFGITSLATTQVMTGILSKDNMKTQQTAEAAWNAIMDGHFKATTIVVERIEKLHHQIETEERKLDELRDKFIEKRKAYDVELATQPWLLVPHLSDRADGVKGHFSICRKNDKLGHYEWWNEDTKPGKWTWPGSLYVGEEVAQKKLNQILEMENGSSKT